MVQFTAPIGYADTEDSWKQYMDWTEEVGKYMGCDTSIWSISEVMDFNEVPYPDIMVMEYDGRWGKPQRFVFEKSPTWADLWEAGDKAIRLSGDLHHVFIEDFIPTNGVLKMVTGS